MKTDYHINVFYSENDQCWVADIPDLEFCSALGDSPEEAMKEILIAKDGWLQVARENGVDVPDARYRPAIYQLANAH